MIMNPDLAAVHAYLCADGYVVKNPPTQKVKYYRLGLRNTNLTLLQDFQNKFEKVFGIKPRLVEGERCEKGSKEIYHKVTNEFGSFYSADWKIPELNKECAALWLRAYFDCEGWVQARKAKDRSICAECINCEGLSQVRDLLQDKFDIRCKIRKRGTRKIWALDIYGKENIIKFKENIRFLHERKKAKLDEAINSFIDYHWNFQNIKEIIQRKAKVRKSKAVYMTSIIKENLDAVSDFLAKLGILSKVYGPRINGLGTKYYELNIRRRESKEKLIKEGLLAPEQVRKWKKMNCV